MLDVDTCYRALEARDRRFDGRFFVGVSTTGIYCRPICPARVPARARCTFFTRAAEAEHAGFRACLRCRPELAPGARVVAPVDAVGRLVHAANARIEEGYLAEGSLEELARELGVTSRHLRRAFTSELGVSPIEVEETRRLALAKQLLHDTTLPLTEIAFASGFQSVRRFNAAFRARFGAAPSSLRRAKADRVEDDAIELRLDYRPPLDWEHLLGFLAGRAIAGVEQVDAGEYRRTVRLGDALGWLSVAPDPEHPRLVARVSTSLARKLPQIVRALRGLFDLDAEPAIIAEHLAADPRLASSVKARPGLRVPGAFDGFETAIRAVLGQQVTVKAATTISGRLVAHLGAPIDAPAGFPSRTFPTPAKLAAATSDEVAKLGMPEARAKALIAIADAVARGHVVIARGAPPEETIAKLVELPGIGPWTASYVAMRALGWPNAFPGGDLVVKRVLDVTTPRAAEAKASAWAPWRAYAVMHLWASASGGG